MELLCHRNKDLHHFHARIVESHPDHTDSTHYVLLDQTYFFPRGGGQPADRGLINGVPVLNVIEKEGLIWHVTSKDPAQLEVDCIIDEAWRRHFMQQHTGQHILSAALWQMAGITTRSVHLGEQTSTIETDASDISKETLFQIEEQANDAIRQNLQVDSWEIDSRDAERYPLRKPPPVTGRIRLVSVGSMDYSVCCGLHLSRSGELGLIKWQGSEKIRGTNRTIWLIGKPAYADYRQRHVVVEELRRHLSCSIGELVPKTVQLQETIGDLSRQYAATEQILAAEKADALLRHIQPHDRASHTVAAIFNEQESLISKIIKVLLKKQNIIFCIINTAPDHFTWNIGCSVETALDFNAIRDTLLNPFCAKGGGRVPLWKGIAPTPRKAQAFLDHFISLLPNQLKKNNQDEEEHI